MFTHFIIHSTLPCLCKPFSKNEEKDVAAMENLKGYRKVLAEHFNCMVGPGEAFGHVASFL